MAQCCYRVSSLAVFAWTADQWAQLKAPGHSAGASRWKTRRAVQDQGRSCILGTARDGKGERKTASAGVGGEAGRAGVGRPWPDVIRHRLNVFASANCFTACRSKEPNALCSCISPRPRILFASCNSPGQPFIFAGSPSARGPRALKTRHVPTSRCLDRPGWRRRRLLLLQYRDGRVGPGVCLCEDPGLGGTHLQRRRLRPLSPTRLILGTGGQRQQCPGQRQRGEQWKTPRFSRPS